MLSTNLNLDPVLPSLVLHPQLQITPWSKSVLVLVLTGILSVSCSHTAVILLSYCSHTASNLILPTGQLETAIETLFHGLYAPLKRHLYTINCTCDLKSTVICSFLSLIGLVHVITYTASMYHRVVGLRLTQGYQ